MFDCDDCGCERFLSLTPENRKLVLELLRMMLDQAEDDLPAILFDDSLLFLQQSDEV